MSERLRFTLESIGPEGLDVSLELSAEELGLPGEQGDEWRGTLEYTGPVVVRVHLERVGADVLCRGRVSCRARVTCDRCLELFVLELGDEVDTLYSHLPPGPEIDPTEVQEYERIMVEVGPGTARVEYVELAEDLRQRLILALPMKVLCREDCKGLCPTCGANLNEGGCSCGGDWVDPRLEPLRRLLERREEKEGGRDASSEEKA